MSIQRMATALTTRRRLHAITAPRATQLDAFSAALPTLIQPQFESCSYLGMVQMVADGTITLDRERWN